jgi:hypothetical protein
MQPTSPAPKQNTSGWLSQPPKAATSAASPQQLAEQAIAQMEAEKGHPISEYEKLDVREFYAEMAAKGEDLTPTTESVASIEEEETPDAPQSY